MTKRAYAIREFVIQLQALILDSYPLSLGLKGLNPTLSIVEAEKMLITNQCTLQACLVEILENNPEQAEALMKELNLKWVQPPGSEDNSFSQE